MFMRNFTMETQSMKKLKLHSLWLLLPKNNLRKIQEKHLRMKTVLIKKARKNKMMTKAKKTTRKMGAIRKKTKMMIMILKTMKIQKVVKKIRIMRTFTNLNYMIVHAHPSHMNSKKKRKNG